MRREAGGKGEVAFGVVEIAGAVGEHPEIRVRFGAVRVRGQRAFKTIACRWSVAALKGGDAFSEQFIAWLNLLLARGRRRLRSTCRGSEHEDCA